MNWKAFKYLSAFTLPLTALISFTHTGWITFLPLAYAFVFIPLVEITVKPNKHNLAKAEEVLAADDTIYDWLLYAVVVVQLCVLALFLHSLAMQWPTDTLTLVGRITGMGVLCGAFGINVAHELGHRHTQHEQFMAKILLLTSLYMHFFIEHNRGHHKHVSTPDDPASARRGETVFGFWLRSVWGSYLSAWQLEAERLSKKGKRIISLENEMLIFQLIQVGFVASIYWVFGAAIALAFVGAAVFGFLLLETVNYIEHYGLSRQQKADGRYERVMPHHSWNSDHVLGRLLLFELSRHSDHHFNASRKYQVLRHYEHVPQMPTGYPGMMVMALFPPIWFKVMNPKLDGYANSQKPEAVS